MIKEKNPNFKGLWARYNKHEIVKINDEFYIRPVEKSDYEIYNIFDVEKELLVDFLKIGKEALNYADENDIRCDIMSTEPEYQEMVLEFVNKYGLLGELTYHLTNTHIVSSGEVYTQGYSKVEKVSANEYIKPYFIGNDEIQQIDFDNGLNEDIITKVYGRDNPNGQEYAHFNKGEDFSLVFSKSYTEKVAHILLFSRILYRTFSSVENSIWTEDNNKKVIYQKYASGFIPNDIAFKFDFNKEKTYLDWEFNSLIQAIEVILAFNETNDRKEVKMCKHCGKPFVAKNLNSDYDSISCRNIANVYRNEIASLSVINNFFKDKESTYKDAISKFIIKQIYKDMIYASKSNDLALFRDLNSFLSDCDINDLIEYIGKGNKLLLIIKRIFFAQRIVYIFNYICRH